MSSSGLSRRLVFTFSIANTTSAPCIWVKKNKGWTRTIPLGMGEHVCVCMHVGMNKGYCPSLSHTHALSHTYTHSHPPTHMHPYKHTHAHTHMHTNTCTITQTHLDHTSKDSVLVVKPWCCHCCDEELRPCVDYPLVCIVCVYSIVCIESVCTAFYA